MTTGTRADQPVADSEKGDHAVRHHALLYRDEREFLAGTLPHLREGIEAGASTFVVTPRSEAQALRDSLGQDAHAVQFIDPADVYTNPVRAMAAMTAVAKTLGSRPAWVVASDDWSRYPDAIEWVRYDSIFNLSFANVPFRSYCCYNTAVLSSDAIALVRQTHPKILEGDALRDNPQYRKPEAFVGDLDRQPLPSSPQSAASMQILPTELHAVRTFVVDQAKRCGVTADALHNLLVAVTEVATNAIRHGDAPVTLRAWPDAGLICEITDSGNWQPEGFISWRPPESAVDSGFGLWGVGMLCDTVQVRTGANGTTVRLRTCA
ncbi:MULTISPECIES: sensor histidine kinase [Streptomyces]|uniref:Sensor histidine kinase n=1 Tax=Streptomyces dengpaensis TaxID=2049881 RepID=A0ABN5ICP3_9ACTN|nr:MULTISPECIES: sensor histidine kinase [Streptomyces]AVH60696.1 sensor histidine kinase [Streptomyces dengpaensis]